MIDENKLLREIEKQIIFLDGLAVELAEAGDIENMDICDAKAMVLREVAKFTAELSQVEGHGIERGKMKNWTKYENEIKAIGLDFAVTKDGEFKKC